jgi:hypothetical protein
MEPVYIIHHDNIAVYSSKSTFYSGYLQLLHEYYENYDRELPKMKRAVLYDDEFAYLSTEQKQDLIKFLEGSDYIGLFDPEHLVALEAFVHLYVAYMDKSGSHTRRL